MVRKHRGLMLGVGGMAATWLTRVWSQLADRMEIAALVDVSLSALDMAGDTLDIPYERRFTSAAEAFDRVEADFCCIVTPPRFHREAVELACARGLAILSEKPIADSWEGCCAVAAAVRRAGVKMMVTQNYRYTPRILTLKRALAELGPVNYAVCRYASDYREPLSWGAPFRHEMQHSLLVEASIHHFDQLRNLCAADCASITGYEWHPGHARGGADRFAGSGSFAGAPCGLFLMQMCGGSFASYEGNNLATGRANSWHGEYYRLECEGGVASLDADDVVRVTARGPGGAITVRELAPERSAKVGHHAVAAQFLDWLDGGSAPATTLDDNLQSSAMLFAALAAAEQGSVVDVQQLVAQAGA